jgi:hypothetical protein
MNIFFVDSNPALAASMLSNAHVRSQIKESISMLATAHYMRGDDDDLDGLPPPTHRNHPCTKWVMTSRANYVWLYEHLVQLLIEYKLRWGNPNWREKYLDLLKKRPVGIPNKSVYASIPPAVVSEDLKPFKNTSWSNVVMAYRAYYNREKRHLHRWMVRQKPDWIIDDQQLTEALKQAKLEKQEMLLVAP